jgi:transposase
VHFPGVNPGVTIGLAKSLKGGATTMTFYIGADLDSRSALLAAVDAAGEVIREKRVQTNRDAVLRFIEPYRPDVSVAVEATLTYYWFVDVLKEEGSDVHLPHPPHQF